jgi:large subunit ribosomal protein L3
MGHQSGKAKYPRRGSLQFWPRKRAKRIFPRVKSWPVINEPRVLGFAGYKVGMTHVSLIDTKKTSPTYNQSLSVPVTIIESPPVKVLGVRFYKNTPYGEKVVKDILVDKLDKNLKRSFRLPKKYKMNLTKIPDYDFLHLLCHSQPKLITLKKKPEIFELALGGNKEEQFNFAKENIGKEIKASDVLKPGEVVDVLAVSKGKGYSGSVKRFGVKLQSKKTDKKRRRAGNLGPEGPAKVSWKVPQFGQGGYHTRTDYNKWILDIKTDDVSPKSGFIRYGKVKNEYIMLKGSIPGPKKRFVRIRLAIRPHKKIPKIAPQIVSVSKRSQL